MSDTGTVALSVLDLVRVQAQSNGDGPALVDRTDGSGRTMTYTELIQRVDGLARRLRECGVGPEEPVAVLLDRSVESIVAVLAVLAAGGAYCPLDVTVPDVRIAAIVDALGARVAIADQTNKGRLAVSTVVDPKESTVEVADRVAPVQPDGLAYVLFTSGSTGVPKGVAMTHRGLDRLIRWQVADGRRALRTLQFTASSFDVTLQEVLSTLATGGGLVVVPEEVRLDPAALLRVIVAERIQRLFLPYVALQLLAVTAARLGETPSSLEHVVVAGERLIITPAIRALFMAVPGCRLDNHYGPTEAHLVTSLTLPDDPASWPAVPSIGVPVEGVTCHVLDEQLEAQGDVGELYVGGSGLARGYLRDPARTADRFVAGPAGERLYRTGDLVRANADATYEFVGRADDQLKVRGFRVEPAEVEHALLGHPGVEAAAVGLREVADGVSVLTAYLQTAGPVAHREVHEHMRGLLPAYMVPARYVSVASLPRKTTGKVDTRALAELPLPDAGDAASVSLSLPEQITAIWRRVLGHDEFADDDDFFEVGGDSLLATWVVAELSQALGRPVELSVLLEFSTVEGLAGGLAKDPVGPDGHRSSSQIVTLRPGPSGRSVFLVHPLGGELIGYRELARASSAPVRILGIGWTGAPPAFGSTLAEIARVHVEQLRTIHPDGPYLLAGWSFGGVLAFEMAQQLVAAGAVVDFLGLLDANPVIDPLTGRPMAETPFLAMLDQVVARLDDPVATRDELVELTSSETWIQLMGAPIAADGSVASLRTVLDTARACMRAAMEYEPRPYPGPLHLFQAADVGDNRQSRLAAAIRGLCTGECTVTSIAGDHWGFVRSGHVSEAAQQMDAALERAGSAGSASDGS